MVRIKGEGFWAGVLSKSVSGWIVGLSIPASFALAWYLREAVVREWHIQATYPKVEAAVTRHDAEIKALQSQAMPPALINRLDVWLTTQESKDKQKGKP